MSNPSLRIIAVQRSSGAHWQEAMRIYHEVFPAWEREPKEVIARRVNQGRYTLRVGLLAQKVIGFYLLDLNADPGYATLTFLAVDERYRGRGWGGLLGEDVIGYFKTLQEIPWLFVEAQSRQAGFYRGLGLYNLDIDYRVPRFDGPGSVSMQLMVLPKNNLRERFPRVELTRILRHIFLQGYRLDSSDPRVGAQLARVKKDVKLVSWP